MDAQEEVYLRFYNYDFLHFQEYQDGLKQVFETYILQHNENLQPGEPEITDIDKLDKPIKQQLTLQAQVYFFCEKTGGILSLDDYFDWKQRYEQAGAGKTIEQIQKDEEPVDAPYSSNYERVVDLIVSGKPVPGIKQIPDKLSEEAPSEHVLKTRKKPWETDEPVSGSLLDTLEAAESTQ